MRPEPASDAAAMDPFADLFFALVAVVLPAILILLSAMRPDSVAPAASAGPAGGFPADALRITVRGEPAQAIVAGADGLRLTGEAGRIVPLDAVPDDPGLRAALVRLRAEGQPLVVLIEPDGLEGAFLLEPVAAAYGPGEIVQVRAARTCAISPGTVGAAPCASPRGER